MHKMNEKILFVLKCSLGLLVLNHLQANAENKPIQTITPLSFTKAITTAQMNDPWLTGNIHKQKAIEAMSVAASSLPDPKVSVSFANLPVNGFDFSQEGMTQAKIGISQMFPRGDTLVIKREQFKNQSEMYPYQRQNRESKIAVTVGNLWLDAYSIQESIALIEKNRVLFEQLVDIAEASYSSALGKTRQQDIVRAQLELTRLEDRLAKLEQRKSQFSGMLSKWLIQSSQEKNETSMFNDVAISNSVFSKSLPQIDLVNNTLVYNEQWLKPNELVLLFVSHPSIIAIEKKANAAKTGIKLAQQKYKPEWGVSASYGYRADDAMGSSRADLFSVGVAFDLPIFTENKQDKEVQSAIYQSEFVKTEKILQLRELISAFISAKGRLLRLKERQNLYKVKLLPQIHDQADASLTAYTNDDGDFSEVVRSRIALLNAEIDELILNVEEQKIHLELNYLFVGNIITNSTRNKKKFADSRQIIAAWERNNEH